MYIQQIGSCADRLTANINRVIRMANNTAGVEVGWKRRAKMNSQYFSREWEPYGNHKLPY